MEGGYYFLLNDYGTACITYRDEDSGFTFDWHGGCYVDVIVNGEAVDVINVWDDEGQMSVLEWNTSGKTRPFVNVLVAFEDCCRAWLTTDAWAGEE